MVLVPGGWPPFRDCRVDSSAETRRYVGVYYNLIITRGAADTIDVDQSKAGRRDI